MYDRKCLTLQFQMDGSGWRSCVVAHVTPVVSCVTFLRGRKIFSVLVVLQNHYCYSRYFLLQVRRRLRGCRSWRRRSGHRLWATLHRLSSRMFWRDDHRLPDSAAWWESLVSRPARRSESWRQVALWEKNLGEASSCGFIFEVVQRCWRIELF